MFRPINTGNDVNVLEPVIETICEYFPKMGMSEFITLIADTFGLWFGISIGLLLRNAMLCTKCENMDDFLVYTSRLRRKGAGRVNV